jgi:hypothetical protein
MRRIGIDGICLLIVQAVLLEGCDGKGTASAVPANARGEGLQPLRSAFPAIVIGAVRKAKPQRLKPSHFRLPAARLKAVPFPNFNRS